MRQQVASAIIYAIFFLTILLTETVIAKPVTQSFTINPGWNAIFLEVEPVWVDQATADANPGKEPTDPDIVFALLTGLTNVWMWNPQGGTVEFIQDPNSLVPQGPDMLVYDPNAAPIVTDLHAIHGNHAYLINYGGLSSVTWNVMGEPLPPQISWKPNSFNFVGFHLDPGVTLPFFNDFFASSPAHNGQDIYVLDNSSGTWIKNPASEMKSGEGFWVYCEGSSEFNGPLTVQLGQGRDLQYGTVLEQQDITIKPYSADTTVAVSLADGIAPSGLPDYPLFYWEYDPSNNIARWTRMPASPASLALDISASEPLQLKLGVKRTGLTADIEYTTNLQLSDDSGSLVKIPVIVTGISYAGLWVGDATINRVDQTADNIDQNEAVVNPTGSLFSYRLIIHIDDSGQARLLNQVIQMWNEDSSEFVLFSDDALIGSYSGSSLRDGQPVGRRISSPAFGNFYIGNTMVNQQEMTGIFAQPDGTLTASLLLPKDDPSNPFVHIYHPDHLSPGETVPADKVFAVSRDITLNFTDTDSDNNSILGSTALGWGASSICGIYREKIGGLLRADKDIHIEGTFILHRVSDIDTLQ